ncbi:hypothetical protein BSKO_14106 [Bryopsis sp. KO-2023]|nr:hypothetical protein BSKO_14106 [Bryopsis sp. KO-2023]
MVRFTSFVVGGILLSLAVVSSVNASPGMDKDIANAAASVKKETQAFQKQPSVPILGRKLRQTNDQELLASAISNNDRRAVSTLVRRTDVNAPIKIGDNEKTPLEIAVIFGEAGLIPVLIQAGANPNLVREGTTPLIGTIVLGDPASAKALLNNGADPELLNPIILAVLQGDTVIVSLLIEAGVDPNDEKLKLGELTLLFTASVYGKFDVVDVLVAAGADTSVRVDGFNYIGVRCACRFSEDEDVQEFCTTC